MAKQQERDAVRQGFNEILAGNNDILSGIIDNDRRRAGRTEKTITEDDERIDDNTKIKTKVIEVTTYEDNDPNVQYDHIASNRAKTPDHLIAITIRIPEDLNDWLADQAHAHRKEGVTKQNLIADGVRLLISETNRRAETF